MLNDKNSLWAVRIYRQLHLVQQVTQNKLTWSLYFSMMSPTDRYIVLFPYPEKPVYRYARHKPKIDKQAVDVTIFEHNISLRLLLYDKHLTSFSQLYQDRICIKDMPSSASGKNTDRLVVIEPNFISDPDLVKYSTGLRLVLNKKRGSFQLQVAFVA